MTLGKLLQFATRRNRRLSSGEVSRAAARRRIVLRLHDFVPLTDADFDAVMPIAEPEFSISDEAWEAMTQESEA